MENRDTFLNRLHEPPGSVFFSEEETARIELVYDFAKYAHRAQGRKDGSRYFEHPRRVALLVIDRIGLYDAATIIACLLHDGVEDCGKYVTPIKIRILGGEEAARRVRVLSKAPKEGYHARLCQADWWTILVKLCDRFDNFSDLEAADEAFQRKQTIETRVDYLPLFRYLTTIAPDPYRTKIVAMVDELDAMVSARAAKLGLEG